VSLSPDGTRLASGSWDNTVKVWDVRSGAELLNLHGHTGQVTSLSFSPDGTRLASSSYDNTVKVWDARTGAEVLTLRGHTRAVASVSFSPDGTRLASGSWDNTVKVWDARIAAETLTLYGHTGQVTSVAFSPDGTRLASSSHDTTLNVWDVRTGAAALTLRGHDGEVRSVAFSPDGTRLASGSMDKTVKLWDARSGAGLLTLRGHIGTVASVAFSPDGTRLASGSTDKMVKLWNARSGAELLTLRGHIGTVASVAFSPDGKLLESKNFRGNVITWEIATGEPVDKKLTSAKPPANTSPDGKTKAVVEWSRILLISTDKPRDEFDPWAEEERRRRAFEVAWHAEDAEQAVRTDDSFAANFHLAYLESLADLQPTDLKRRDLCRERVGRQAPGTADLAQADSVRYKGAETLQWQQWQARIFVKSHNQESYRRACQQLLLRVGPRPAPDRANQVALICSLAPGAVDHPAEVVALAERAVASDPRNGYVITTLGAALLRKGRTTDAIAKLEESLQLLGPPEFAHNELLLAIAHHRLGQEAEARHWLNAAAAKMDFYRAPAAACGTLGVGPVGGLPVAAALLAKRPDPREGKDDNSLRNWLEMDVLRAEAEEALANTAPR
jgi:WD40 repeat protein